LYNEKELNMNTFELDELAERRYELQERINNFFGGESPEYGDQGYQDLLQSLDSVNERINELQNE
jgi:hypothetical protein